MSHERIARGLWRWKTWDSFHCTSTALAVHPHSQHHCLYIILQQLDKQETIRKKERKRKKKLVCLTTNQWQHQILSMKTKMSPIHADGWRLRKNKLPQKKSIIISIIKVLVHWKFSLIPQSISQGKNKFFHFDWLIDLTTQKPEYRRSFQFNWRL